MDHLPCLLAVDAGWRLLHRLIGDAASDIVLKQGRALVPSPLRGFDSWYGLRKPLMLYASELRWVLMFTDSPRYSQIASRRDDVFICASGSFTECAVRIAAEHAAGQRHAPPSSAETFQRPHWSSSVALSSWAERCCATDDRAPKSRYLRSCESIP
jgi:hypothetical protein